jgi:hypothetical protein
MLIEWFMFMERFAAFLDPGSEVVYQLSASNLNGRQLVFYDWWKFRLDPSEPCKASSFARSPRTIGVETLRGGWEEECARTMHSFFELFPGPRITIEVFQEWIKKFQRRDFR